MGGGPKFFFNEFQGIFLLCVKPGLISKSEKFFFFHLVNLAIWHLPSQIYKNLDLYINVYFIILVSLFKYKFVSVAHVCVSYLIKLMLRTEL